MTKTEKHIMPRIGFLTIGSYGNIEFVHRTFAEYFLADYVLSIVPKEIGKLFLFHKILEGFEHQKVWRFMNDALDESEEHFKELLSMNMTQNFNRQAFISSLTRNIKEKNSKLLKLLLTNDEFKNDMKTFIKLYNAWNDRSFLLDSARYCTVEMFNIYGMF